MKNHKIFFIPIIPALLFLIPFFSFAQITKYTPLADYDGILEPAISGGFSSYLNTMMGIMIAVAAVAAVVMIVAGGLQYMTTDAVNNKADGKKKITSAIGGLILALSSWLILNTINPNILEFDFKVDNVAEDSPEFREYVIQLGKVMESTGEEFLSYPGTPGDSIANEVESARKAVQAYELASGDIETDAQRRLLNSARYYAEKRVSTKNLSGGGNLACADAACAIINSAYDEPPIKKNMSSTITLRKWLEDSSKFALVGNGFEGAKPGDIIISPTSGSNTGHVGVINEVGGAGGGRIISNSSSQKLVYDNYSIQGWENRYKNNKGLPLYIYRPQ